jgi:hypothetical protein
MEANELTPLFTFISKVEETIMAQKTMMQIL